MSNRKSSKTKLITTRLELEILEAMERCIKAAGCQRNAWVKQAVCKAIQQQEMMRPGCQEADLAFLQK